LKLRRIVSRVAVVILVCGLAIPWHETVGHALTGLACGGTITEFQLFGLQFAPQFRWIGLAGGRGHCELAGIGSEWCAHLTNFAGSTSSFAVALGAAFILWRYKPVGLKRTALLSASFWAVDLLTAMLPSFGIRRYIWAGMRYSEPYEAAIGLGAPGPLFQAAALAGVAAVLLLVTAAMRGPEPRKL
jgi:hypothetical protein